MKTVNTTDLFLGKVKWDEMFDSEEELIDSLKLIDIEKYIKGYYKGYEYVRSFQRAVLQGKGLTPKQVTQLKRVSKEMYKYLNNI